MKYIKHFEFQHESVYRYYKIHNKGSIELIYVALYKLGLLEQFLIDWEIKDYDELWDIIPEYLNGEYVYLILHMEGDDVFSIYIRETKKQIDESFSLYYEKIYEGEIEITEDDIKHYKMREDLNKYNL